MEKVSVKLITVMEVNNREFERVQKLTLCDLRPLC